MDKNKKLFPQRLWELVNDEKYNFCLRWSPDGQRIYLNRNDFETHYLRTPNNQFHTQKAISFVRQMNMYGFRKVDDCYYENDNFKRNCYHLLKNMVRRHSNKPNQNNLTYLPSSSLQQRCSSVTNDGGHVGHGCGGVGGSASSSSSSGHDIGVERNDIENIATDDTYHTLDVDDSNNINDAATSSGLVVGEQHRQQQQMHENLQQQQQQQQQQQASIQTLLQQFACLSQSASRESAEFRRQAGQLPGLQNHVGVAASNSGLDQATAAAINAAGITQSSLASALYQRLASLSFDSSQTNMIHEHQYQRDNGEFQHQLQNDGQQDEHEGIRSAEAPASLLAINRAQVLANNAVRLPFNIQQNQQVLSPSAEQQALAVRQALFQQTLIRSLLQLKQPQHQINSTLEQNLLSSLQQQHQRAGILLNQLPLASSLAAAASQPRQQQQQVQQQQEQQQQTIPANNLSLHAPKAGPLELVVSSSSSSINSEHDPIIRSHSTREDDSIFNMSGHSSNLGCRTQQFKRSVDFVDDVDEDYSTTDHDDEPYNQAGRFLGNNLSLSPRLNLSPRDRADEQQVGDSDDFVLNLARPPTKRSREETNTS